MYARTISIIFLFVIFSCINASAFMEGAAPYSQEAVEKFGTGGKKFKMPPAEPGMSPEEKIKWVASSARKYFSLSGYSFDKTVVKLKKDLEKDPDFFKKNEAAMIILSLTQQYCQILAVSAQKQNVSLEKVFSADVAKAIHEIGIEYERKADKKAQENKAKEQEELTRKLEAKKAEEEKNKKIYEEKKKMEEQKKLKEQAEIKLQKLNQLPGHYENLQGNKAQGKKYGELNIELIDSNNIKFGGNNKMFSTNCNIADKVATISYSYEDSAVSAFFEDSQGDCILKFKFAENELRGNFVSVEQNGKCSAYCGRGGSMRGNYNKQQKNTTQIDSTAQTQSPHHSNLKNNENGEKDAAIDPIKAFKGLLGR